MLIALPQYVRHSLVLALIAMIGYAAAIVIMTIGSPPFTAPEESEEAGSSPGDAAEGDA